MRFFKYLIALIFLGIVLFSCKSRVRDVSENDVEVKENRQSSKPLTLLTVDAHGNSSHSYFKIEEVLEDSRCPVDVTCVWAGSLKVAVGYYKNQKKAAVKTIDLMAAEPADIKWLLDHLGSSEAENATYGIQNNSDPVSVKNKKEALNYCFKLIETTNK